MNPFPVVRLRGPRLRVARRVRSVPLHALAALLSGFTRGVALRHPAILRRLGDKAGCRFLLDVADAPVLLVLQPARRRLTVHERGRVPPHDAAIRGRLAGFRAMLDGTVDGDALFFSGELEIAGDTAAVLALRNALDDARLDLAAEACASAGPAGPLLRPLVAVAERLSERVPQLRTRVAAR